MLHTDALWSSLRSAHCTSFVNYDKIMSLDVRAERREFNFFCVVGRG